MKQYIIEPNETFTTKMISIFADEYHKNEWNCIEFTVSGELIAIFNSNEFIVKEGI